MPIIKFIIGLLIILYFAISLYGYYSKSKKCADAGGFYARGAFEHQCIKAEKIIL